MTDISVADLVIYPIKGSRGSSLETVEVTSEGFTGDRVFTVTRDGKRVAQKQIPRLKYLQAVWSKNGLELNYPGRKSFLLEPQSSGPGGQLMSITRTVATIDMGEAVANWLSHCLEETVRLVKAASADPLAVPLAEFKLIDGMKQAKFVDIAPVLLTNEATLLDLNSRLSAPVLMNRFRPNLVLRGLLAYQEDALQQLVLPTVNLQNMVVCERCAVTTFSQESDLSSKEPLQTLSRYRRRENHYAGGVMFGTYLACPGKGTISLGDRVTLAESSQG
ncbi:MAG: MOSC domain-containing protein [Gammaproteobacteria bacterium]|jgi:uncharacterized protein|nr:MOSC domain-containing protein [Gammaproteobacteria bacterium]MBT5203264.1 MOSC domain-containing protein [Gammaproteobacteria bacterium]MBT5604212.1 MOSC domain-containing protein [Gammaproteobacteria bacterium]